MRVCKYISCSIAYGVLLLVLMLNQSQALLIEAISKGEQPVGYTENLMFYPRKFTINFKPDGGGSFDPKCLTVKGKVGSNEMISIEGWGGHAMNHKYAGNFRYDVVVTNRCGLPIVGTVETQFTRTSPTGKGKLHKHKVSIDSQKCSVDVATSPKIPDIYPRESIPLVKITSNISGNGTLSFIPGQNKEKKGVLRNSNQDYITYSIADMPWNDTLKGWSGKLHEYSIKIDQVTSSTKAGIYTGVMQVRISCP
ncbi:hypothetical protein M2263_000946 [Providencia alcalifaciens]|nr:hypothetical protein [Providencia alcalifaciens]